MPIRVAIDGFSGVSRQIVAAVLAGGFSDLFEIVAINEPAGSEAVLRRLRFDTNYGRFPAVVGDKDGSITIDERDILVSSTEIPDALDWAANSVDLVIVDGSRKALNEVTAIHIERGAKKVVVAGAPGEGGRTIVFGLNEGSYDPDAHHIVGTGTARLNALAPLASVIQKHFAIARGSFTIVHPLVGGQSLVDAISADALFGRSALNIAPRPGDKTSIELGEIEPILGSKLLGSVVHVPTTPVGWITLAVETERRFELDAAIAAFTDEAASDQFAGLIGLSRDWLVSRDVTGDAHSVVVLIDELSMSGRAFVSVRGWFDAEWALACRTADLIALVCEAGIPGTA